MGAIYWLTPLPSTTFEAEDVGGPFGHPRIILVKELRVLLQMGSVLLAWYTIVVVENGPGRGVPLDVRLQCVPDSAP